MNDICDEKYFLQPAVYKARVAIESKRTNTPKFCIAMLTYKTFESQFRKNRHRHELERRR